MIAMLEYDAETGILLVYQTGQRTEADAGSQEGMLADEVAKTDPSGFLYVMDHARWDVSHETWLRSLKTAATMIGTRPAALVMPSDFPDEQVALLFGTVSAFGLRLETFRDEEEARDRLSAEIASSRKKCS